MRKYYRFIDGLRKFAKARIEPDEAIALARTLLKKRIAEREENFLCLAERGIFHHEPSPYRPLLEAKHIGFGDLQSWVAKDGLEGALRALQAEGVYFTVDEFKGKTPVQRNGRTFICNEAMFDNPFSRSCMKCGVARRGAQEHGSALISITCISGRSTMLCCSTSMAA